jgi:hypothetical protein
MTAFRRRLRYRQGRWRDAHGHPLGTQPLVPREGKPVRFLGSRLPLEYARETGANFLTPGALEATRARSSVVEPRQSFEHQRLWADLLWSPTLAFNLFGDLAADRELADQSGTWMFGRYVVVHPEGNVDFAEACARYRSFLADETTFASLTLEELLGAGALPKKTEPRIRER